ncbi:MAG: hypothetical protein H6923_00460 [Alphaproteobacteria bacterium]|nr:hypothetical protein [Alphaproteobacteria bacterium]
MQRADRRLLAFGSLALFALAMPLAFAAPHTTPAADTPQLALAHLYGEWTAVASDDASPVAREGGHIVPARLVFRPDSMRLAGEDLPVERYEVVGNRVTAHFSAQNSITFEWQKGDLLCGDAPSLTGAGSETPPSAATRICYRRKA